MANRRRRHVRRRRKAGNWFTRLSIGKRIAVCAGGVIVCLAASTVIYVAAKLSKLDTNEIDKENIKVNELAEEVGEGYTNFALFGIDSREGELEIGTRSDCLIVVSLNNETKEIRMASVYRDTLLDLSDGTLQKCNAAYSMGGPEQAINMLNMNLDLDIKDYVTVDFAAIADAIDQLGGLDIEVNEVELKYLNKFLNETARVAGKKSKKLTEAGTLHLDGVQATTYARIRSTAGGDFTRTERQRLVIEKMAEKAQKSDLGTINNIIDSVFPKVSTSMSVADILSYAKSFAKYKIGESGGFPFDKTTDTISGLGSIVIPVDLQSNVQKLHEFLYGTQDYTPSEKVQSISAAVKSRVGERQAEDEEAIKNKTYTPSAEDKAQERSTPSRNSGTSSGNNSKNNSKKSSSSGNKKNNSTNKDKNSNSGSSGNSGNNSNKGDNSGGSTNDKNEGGSGGDAGNNTKPDPAPDTKPDNTPSEEGAE